MEILIDEFEERYSITNNSKIYCHYKYDNQGNKIFNKKELKVYENQKSKGLRVSLFKKGINYSHKTYFVYGLLEKYFNLKPPDTFHKYRLFTKNNNPLDFSLDNLEYRIVNLINPFKYYPQPFYNDKGDITHKICCECGNKSEIKNFSLQKPKRIGENITYKNKCYSCISKGNWNRIQNSDVSKEKYLKCHKKYQQTNSYKEFIEKHKKLRKDLDNYYIINCLIKAFPDKETGIKIEKEDITKELIEVKREELKTFHLITNYNKNLKLCQK